jgi:hypothetical protein
VTPARGNGRKACAVAAAGPIQAPATKGKSIDGPVGQHALEHGLQRCVNHGFLSQVLYQAQAPSRVTPPAHHKHRPMLTQAPQY